MEENEDRRKEVQKRENLTFLTLCTTKFKKSRLFCGEIY